ncbi:MAG TPA: DUF2130 domain-containing protein [Vitreimonas sp.]|nr:DUF2130 domain-containing protein [Vitreimonas sp.]
MPAPTIICPHCQKPISVDEALSHQISAKLEEQYQAQLAKKDEELTKSKQATAAQLAKVQAEAEAKLITQLAAEKQAAEQAFKKQLETELKKTQEQAKSEATESVSKELTLLKQQLDDRNKKLDEARQLELDLRKQKNQLEDDKKAFELEKQRQLDMERAKIKEEAEKKAVEIQELKMLEMQKQLNDALKANEDMRRKLQQGSQQTQGEVLELELENLLRTEFPMDEIQPVAKGVRGADVLQIVKDRQGKVCGSILWELKNAQWSDKWIDKLREDQRNSKADLAVLVSINVPPAMKDKSFIYQKGIWIATRPICTALAQALRLQLNQVHTTKLSAVGKNEKMEVLYQYLTGTEFKQRVEAIVDAFSNMQQDLEKEKRWFQTKWKRQEMNIRQVLDSTFGMYGDMQGIMGASLPEIKQLQLESGEDNQQLSFT